MNIKSNHYLDLKKLLSLNKEGIFPGPAESEGDFFERIQKLRASITLPGVSLSDDDWKMVHPITERLFDIQPTWVPAFYRDKKLSFWEAAAVWDCEGRSVVQLRNRLAKGHWGLVKQQEVLAHEAAHAARMAFHESRFEEMICYQTSKLSWRRRLGPLFRHPWEAVLCVSAAAMGWVFGVLNMLTLALIIPWIPFLYFSLRLLFDRVLFQRCLKNIRPLLNEPAQALAVTLRLTDQEIVFFGRASHREVKSYIQEQLADLRWKVIAAAYFSY